MTNPDVTKSGNFLQEELSRNVNNHAVETKKSRLFRTIPGKSFLKNVATMATGTTVVQIIGIAASPFITRLYGPEAFGVLGIFLAILSIFNPVATLTYSTAVVLPKADEEAKNIIKAAFLSSAVIAAAVAFILVLFKNPLVAALNLDPVADYILLIPIVIFLIGTVQIFNQWLIRKALYKRIALLSIVKALVINISKIGTGLFHATATVLIVLASFGYMLQAILFYLGMGRNKDKTTDLTAETGPEQVKNQPASHILKTARKFRNFPFYRAPQMLIGAFSKGIPVLMLAYFFGPAAAGFFAIANRVLQLPAGIIGKSIGSVFYPKIADVSHEQKNIRPYITSATGGMAVLAFVPMFVVGIFGPTLFEWVFGQGWAMAGHYARWLAILVFFEFILHPSKDAMLVAGMQKMLLVFEGTFFVLKTLMLITGLYLLHDDIMALFLYSMAGAVVSVVFLFFAHKKIPAVVNRAYG